MTEKVAKTRSAKTASVASAEIAAGPAIATRTATEEILLHADPENDQDRQCESPEAQVALDLKGTAGTTTETATSADGRRSDIGIATGAGIATIAEMTVMVIVVDEIGLGMGTEINGERGRKRKKRNPNLPLHREVKR